MAVGIICMAPLIPLEQFLMDYAQLVSGGPRPDLNQLKFLLINALHNGGIACSMVWKKIVERRRLRREAEASVTSVTGSGVYVAL